MIGTRLGPYELLDELGQGGMATVFLAYQPNMDRHVAVKVIHHSLANDAAGRARFQREARLIARLEHPHILPVYDFDGAHTPPYIVMRYLGGGTLKDALHRGRASSAGSPLPLNDIAYLLRQIAAALDYAHRQGIVHSDIKPSNIIVDNEGNAFLSDFGIARVMGDVANRGGGGTPEYMAPEISTKTHEIGPPADLYSLGVLIFEVLTGRTPFATTTFADLIARHVNEMPPRATAFNADLPARVDEVLWKALAKLPAERYASATDLVATLTAALGITFTHTPTQLQSAARATGADADATPLVPVLTPTEQNKLVTALYANAAEYAELMDETGGAEGARAALRTFWERARQVIARQGGQAIPQNEIAWLAVWGAEMAREDDAERAVRAALELQVALREIGAEQFAETEDEPLPLKVGVNTGTALVTTALDPSGQGYFGAAGVTVTLAQRLAELAEGAILISNDTFREVRGVFDLLPAGPLKVRGRKEPVEMYRVIAAKPRPFRGGVRGLEGVETRLIGRETELKQLQNAYLNAVEDHETQCVTLLGEAGLGKSRLLDAFDKWAELRPEEYWTFEGRAIPAMTHRPYALLRDLLSFRFEILDSDPPATMMYKLERGVAELLSNAPPASEVTLSEPVLEMAHLVGHLAGFDCSASPQVRGLAGDPQQLATRARQLALRLFTQTAQASPIVCLLEDSHWADEASLDLFTALVSEQPHLPLLIVSLARPMLFERCPAWGGGLEALRHGGTVSHHLIELRPLDRRDSRDLAREILRPVRDLPREVRDLLVERAEGNPLFMEELVRMLIEDRVIIQGPEAWSVETSRLAGLRVPHSLAGLLHARLDTLLAPEKVALQRAAVVGRVFYDSALRALDPPDDSTLRDLDAVLRKLVERGFIYRRETSALAGSEEYLFAQAMLRDILYDSLLHRQQRAYHTGVANWLNAVSGERRGEYLPVIAEHYEHAGEAAKARAALREAGDRAYAVSAFAEARQFFERALGLLPAPTEGNQSVERAQLELKLGQVQLSLSNFAMAQTLTVSALAAASLYSAGALTALALAQLGDVALAQGQYTPAETYFTEALPLARASAEPATLARVLFGLGNAAWRLGQIAEARVHMTDSLALAREINDPVRILYGLNGLSVVARSEGNLDEAKQLREEVYVLALAVGNRERAAMALNNLGVIAEERGHFTAAQDYYRQALGLAREIGAQQSLALYHINLGNATIPTGNFTVARDLLHEGLTLALTVGALPWVVLAVIDFAHLIGAQGNVPRALALLGRAQSHPAFSSDHRRDLALILAEWELNPATREAGLAQGVELDWEAMVAELLNL